MRATAKTAPGRRPRHGATLGGAVLGLALGALALAPTALAQEGRLELFINHAKIIKLAEPASTVIIGNNEIADATVKDALTLVLTGRQFGATNLVILDEAGEPIVDERLVVRRDEGDTVRLFSPAGNGIAVRESVCSPVCVLNEGG